jgi:hypothetical protein
MRSILVSTLVIVGCVGGDDSSTKDSGGPDVTANEGGSDVATQDVATDANDAGPWTPAALDADGSLAFWFDTSISANVVISSGMVGKWVDRSKNHNDATNATGGPTVSAAAIKGFDALHFASKGVVLTMADSATIQFSNDQLAIFGVARASTPRIYFFSKHTESTGGAGNFFKTGIEFDVWNTSDAGTTLAPYVHFAEDPTNSGTPTDYAAGWNGSVFDDGKFHIVGMRRPTPGSMVLFADSLPTQTTQTGGYDVSEPGKAAEIGAVGYGGTFVPPYDGDIVEIVAVHATIIPDSVITNLQSYLKAKYAL